ncbi:hypothetical protein [Bacillus alkalicellulosilyticus]|uniref:hypothetical protein n=1 Tax=Alkalihalobacterium alkalicellulosilyticum TaxID=1912214 RepID=UPI0009983310|nr:hypothetical protein [Bacillus alkalicellulosilyticus]
MSNQYLSQPNYNEIETTIIALYKELTNQNYLTEIDRNSIAGAVLLKLDRLELENHEKIAALLLTINGILSLSMKFSTYRPFEQRFVHFFTTIIDENRELFAEIGMQSSNEYHHVITEDILYFYFEFLSTESAPWDRIFRYWISKEQSKQQLQNYLALFVEKQHANPHHVRLAIITSLLALYCEDGSLSISYLRPHKKIISASDLYDHFSLLQEREEWDMLKSWLSYFKSNWKNDPIVERIYDQMVLHLNEKPKDHFVIWEKWLKTPSFKSYLANKQKYQIAESDISHILSILHGDLFNPAIERLYLQILNEEKRITEAVSFFLLVEKNPLQLAEEKVNLLSLINKEQPEKLIAIYHQFVIRLVEKKTRQHYEEAVVFIGKLQRLYKKLDKQSEFSSYIQKLKQHYRTYRALIQEMKSLEL